MRNCTLTGNQLFQDILSYNLPLIGCSESSSDEDISAATGGKYISVNNVLQCFLNQLWTLEVNHSSCFCSSEKYMKKLFGTNKDRMGVDQKAVLLVSKVNESKRHGE